MISSFLKHEAKDGFVKARRQAVTWVWYPKTDKSPLRTMLCDVYAVIQRKSLF